MSEYAPPARGHRIWVPAATVVLAVAGIAVVRYLPELERNLKNWATAGITALALILILLWFLLLSRFRWKHRLLGFAAVALLLLGMKTTVKVVGTVDGTGRPKLAWRWTPTKPPATPTNKVENVPVREAPGARDVANYFGPEGTGIVRGGNLSSNWSSRPPKKMWRQPVGAGWSSFAVVGGRAFTQEQRGEDEAVTCYELISGRLLWMHTHKAHFYQWQGGHGPRATPTVRDGRVYATGGTGVLDCLDAETGKELWSRDVLKESGGENITWGISASPLVFGDKVVVTGGKGGHTVLAFNTITGAREWQSGSDEASYASPSLVRLLGRNVVMVETARVLALLDPETGALLLEHPWSGSLPAKASQPVVVGNDRIFVSAGYGAGCVLLKIESGADGKFKAEEAWRNLKMKTQFNSVALSGDHLYGLDDGRLACVDVKTGERLWKDGRFGSGQSLIVDDLIIVQSESGDVALCSANSESYRELGRIPALDSKTWNHPVVAGNYLLVRNDQEAVCYELPTK